METYTHFTSPIRRLCDLVIHHQLKSAVIHSETVSFGADELERMSSIASEKELIADQSEREVERFIVAEFMKKNLGEEFTGIVTGMNNTNVFVQLDQIPISGVLPTSSMKGNGYYFDDEYLRIVNDDSQVFLQLVDKVKVQVSQVTDDVYLALKEVITSHDSFSLSSGRKRKKDRYDHGKYNKSKPKSYNRKKNTKRR